MRLQSSTNLRHDLADAFLESTLDLRVIQGSNQEPPAAQPRRETELTPSPSQSRSGLCSVCKATATIDCFSLFLLGKLHVSNLIVSGDVINKRKQPLNPQHGEGGQRGGVMQNMACV